MSKRGCLINFINLFVILQIVAQTGLHDVNTKIQKAYFSEDEAKFLTAGYIVKGGKLVGQELVLWDKKAILPIWRKTLTDFGIVEGSPNYFEFGIADPTLKYLTIEHSSSKVKYLLQLESFKSKVIGRDFVNYLSNDQLLIIQSETDVNNKARRDTKLIILNLQSNEEKVIDDYVYGASLNKNRDKIIYFKKNFFKKSIVNYYEFEANKFGTYPLEKNNQLQDQLNEKNEINIGTYYFKEGTGEYCEFMKGSGMYAQGQRTRIGKYLLSTSCDKTTCAVTMSENTFSDKPHRLELIALKERNVGDKEIVFVNKDYNFNSLFTIESGLFNQDGTNLKFSFLREYDYESGKLISEIPLTRLTDQAIADSKIKYEEYRKRDEAQQQYLNSNEGKTRKRMFDLWNLFLYSPETKLIYQVVPDMPLYVGNLVKLNALHDDKKQITEVYEKIENVENRDMYHVILGHQKCIPCNGRGYFSNSYQSTVADYEYTSGKKLVRTTTVSGSCPHCGGCGLVPKK